jgi:hypothetical protein
VSNPEGVIRKALDNMEFVRLRQGTDRISAFLGKRLAGHLDALQPLFLPRKLLGTYIKSAVAEDVPVSDKAFADLQERFAAVAEAFGLPKKLTTPLPAIATQLDAVPWQYLIACEGGGDKPVTVTSPTRWVVSYRGEYSVARLRAMLSGAEAGQPDEMRQALVNHLAFGVYLKHFPAMKALLEELRYRVELRELADLGNLPVVMLEAPLQTILPPDDFVLQVTQFSGILAFQEVVGVEAVEALPDPLKEALRGIAAG